MHAISMRFPKPAPRWGAPVSIQRPARNGSPCTCANRWIISAKSPAPSPPTNCSEKSSANSVSANNGRWHFSPRRAKSRRATVISSSSFNLLQPLGSAIPAPGLTSVVQHDNASQLHLNRLVLAAASPDSSALPRNLAQSPAPFYIPQSPHQPDSSTPALSPNCKTPAGRPIPIVMRFPNVPAKFRSARRARICRPQSQRGSWQN